MRSLTLAGLWASLAAELLCAAPRVWAQPVDPVKAAEVEAAYLVNFARYTEWPTGVFPAAESPCVVVVIGSTPVARALRATQTNLTIAGRPLETRELPIAGLSDEAWTAGLREAQVVFIGAGAASQVTKILGFLHATDVLTVGDTPGFAASGGMLGLVRDGNRIVFDANPAAIRETRLVVSARVLKLARIVGESAAQGAAQ